MEWLNLFGFVGLFVAGLKAYKDIMKAYQESKDVYDAVLNVNAVFQRAYADKKIDNEEIALIEDAVEAALKEGKEATEAWMEAKDKVLSLIEEAKKK